VRSLISYFSFALTIRLGQTKHILRSILLNGGMFNGKGQNEEKRRDRFEEFLDAIWWPGSVGRPPKKVHSLFF